MLRVVWRILPYLFNYHSPDILRSSGFRTPMHLVQGAGFMDTCLTWWKIADKSKSFSMNNFQKTNVQNVKWHKSHVEKQDSVQSWRQQAQPNRVVGVCVCACDSHELCKFPYQVETLRMHYDFATMFLVIPFSTQSEGFSFKSTQWSVPIISFQTLTPLHTLARFCWKDPDIAVSCETRQGPSKHISGCSQSAIGWITGLPMEKVPKELKGTATL